MEQCGVKPVRDRKPVFYTLLLFKKITWLPKFLKEKERGRLVAMFRSFTLDYLP